MDRILSEIYDKYLDSPDLQRIRSPELLDLEELSINIPNIPIGQPGHRRRELASKALDFLKAVADSRSHTKLLTITTFLNAAAASYYTDSKLGIQKMWNMANTARELYAKAEKIKTKEGETYYEVLGVRPFALEAEIKAGYRDKALKYHPDRNPDDPIAEENFKIVSNAFDVFKDPLKKANYDLKLRQFNQLPSPPGGDEAMLSNDEINKALAPYIGKGFVIMHLANNNKDGETRTVAAKIAGVKESVLGDGLEITFSEVNSDLAEKALDARIRGIAAELQKDYESIRSTFEDPSGLLIYRGPYKLSIHNKYAYSVLRIEEPPPDAAMLNTNNFFEKINIWIQHSVSIDVATKEEWGNSLLDYYKFKSAIKFTQREMERMASGEKEFDRLENESAPTFLIKGRIDLTINTIKAALSRVKDIEVVKKELYDKIRTLKANLEIEVMLDEEKRSLPDFEQKLTRLKKIRIKDIDDLGEIKKTLEGFEQPEIILPGLRIILGFLEKENENILASGEEETIRKLYKSFELGYGDDYVSQSVIVELGLELLQQANQISDTDYNLINFYINFMGIPGFIADIKSLEDKKRDVLIDLYYSIGAILSNEKTLQNFSEWLSKQGPSGRDSFILELIRAIEKVDNTMSLVQRVFTISTKDLDPIKIVIDDYINDHSMLAQQTAIPEGEKSSLERESLVAGPISDEVREVILNIKSPFQVKDIALKNAVDPELLVSIITSLEEEGLVVKQSADLGPETIWEKPVGGINLDPAMLNLQVRRDGKGIPLPLPQQPIGEMNIEGFFPVIIHVVPANVPLLLGFADDKEESENLSYRDLDPIDQRERFHLKKQEQISLLN